MVSWNIRRTYLVRDTTHIVLQLLCIRQFMQIFFFSISLLFCLYLVLGIFSCLRMLINIMRKKRSDNALHELPYSEMVKLLQLLQISLNSTSVHLLYTVDTGQYLAGCRELIYSYSTSIENL